MKAGPIPLVDLQIQYQKIQEEIRVSMETVLTQAHFILGPELESFEKEFASWTGSRYAIGVSSGLDALCLALRALQIGPGDEVILPANTFVATAMAVTAVGAKPVLVDCEPRLYGMAVDQVRSAVTKKTKAILPVHLMGQSAEMESILRIAHDAGAVVIEDAAQAHGATYKGKICGTMGEAGCFSFYPGKNLGCYGDGGMVVTEDAAVFEKIKQLRNYGRTKEVAEVIGFNARLDTLQAAILSVKLKYIDNWNLMRRKNAELYRNLLEGVGDIAIQQNRDDSTHVYHLFVIETMRRDLLKAYLQQKGIQTGIHYAYPIHLQPAYRALGYRKGDFPVSERLSDTMLSLPMFPELTLDQTEFIVTTIKEFFVSR